jgi:hypothetical protein
MARKDAVGMVIAADTYRAEHGDFALDLAGDVLHDLANTMGGKYVAEGNNRVFEFDDD